MSFVFPLFLWALGVLAIPIIIHLFNFRRTTRIYFSTNRFLRQVQEATSAKRKLKHYLILASRLLFLLFLVLTFAQPIIPASEQFSANRNISIYLDNSLSMSVPVEEKTRALDAGIGFVQKITETFPPDARYRILTNDFAPFSNSFKTKSEVQDLLSQIRLSPISRSMEEITTRLGNREDNEEATEVFWITDFQKSTLNQISPELFDTTQRWHMAPLRYMSNTNIFIDTVYLENPFVVGGEKNELHIKLRNYGDKRIEQLLVKVTVNGIQTGATAVTVEAQGSAEVSFDLVTNLNGINKTVISFNDFPVSFDNEFYLALNFSDKIRVVEIKNMNEPTPVERVYGNKDIFNFKSFTSDNVNYSLFAEADLVVVNGLEKFDAGLLSALQNHLNRGSALLCIPHATPDVTSYANLVQTGVVSRVNPLPLADLDFPDFKNPFFENVFEDKTSRMVMPKASRVLNWGNDRSAILKFKDDQPYLSVFNQTGKLYILGSPLANDATTLHNSAIFVPVMYRIAASGKKSDVKPYYTLTESFINFRLDSLLDEQPIKLVGDQEIVPGQRKILNQVIMELPRLAINAGFYKVIQARDTLGLLAFNLSKEESVLAQYSGDEVKQLLGNSSNISIFDSNSAEAFSNEIKERYLGKPLWKYALILALFFLLAEILLIRFLK